MRAVFRADASLAIGTGHVMRCLTLAGALREQGVDCAFVCREHPGHLRDAVERLGFPVTMLSPAEGAAGPSPYAHWLGASQAQDARDTLQAMAGRQPDWVVVDHYALDAQWESQVRAGCGRLLAIDDLADRPHDCDLLLDQNLGRSAQAYAQLCPADCRILAGPAYALLRPEFAAWRARSLERRRRPAVRRILVTMGGVDKDNASAVALQATEWRFRSEGPTSLRDRVLPIIRWSRKAVFAPEVGFFYSDISIRNYECSNGNEVNATCPTVNSLTGGLA